MRVKSLLFTFLAVVIISWPGTGLTAGNTTITPSIQVQGEANDNVYFSRTDAKDDFISLYQPSLRLDYSTPSFTLGGSALWNVYRYATEKEQNSEQWQLSLNGQYSGERSRITFSASRVDDETLVSELDETGLVTTPSERRRDSESVGFSYSLSERSNLGLNYTHSETSYSLSNNVDNDSDGLSLNFTRQLANQRDSITGRFNYTLTDSEIRRMDNYSLSLGWSRSFSQVYSLSASLGGRNTQMESKLDGEASRDEETRGTTIDISLRKTGDNHSASLGYNRDIGISSTAEPIERDRISLQGSLMLSTRFTIGFSGSLSYTKSESDLDEIDSKYYQIAPYISYLITENGSLRIEYNYSNSLDFTLNDDREAERQRIVFSLNFGFPKQL